MIFLSRFFRVPETQLQKFSFAGTLGFVLEGVLLVVFQHWWGAGPFLARLPAFFLTFFLMWAVKRYYIFRGDLVPLAQSLKRYAYASAVGAVLNWGVYSLAVHSSVFLDVFPIFALLLASFVVSPVNFLIVKYGVFRGYQG